MSLEIMVVPFNGQGHLFPCTELCVHLASRNYNITLLLPSPSFSSSLSSSILNHPLIQISPLSTSTEHHPNSFAHLLSSRSLLPACAIVDVMMSWLHDTFRDFNIPTVTFFTSGACSAAMEHSVWKLRPVYPKPGEILKLPGLPDDVSLTFSEFTQPAAPPPPNHSATGPQPHPTLPGGFPPPPPCHHAGAPNLPPQEAGNHGRTPPWVAETEGSIALLMNTCDDLERPFLDYVGRVTEKRVWGVGPLLPAQFWGPADSVVRDREMRSKRESNVTEEEVSRWLDSKQRGSVVYVAFGTEAGPSREELEELADALEESERPFIWAIQSGAGRRPGPPPLHPSSDGHIIEEEESGMFPKKELGRRTEGRGLIIEGWAPQLMILRHPSTGGFVSHVGWNSTMEALGRGVPLLAWPIRGDQHYNAKEVSSHLKVGLMVRAADGATAVRKDDIVRGIEKLMTDDEMRNRAASILSIFGHGFPVSSSASLDAFSDFVQQQLHK